MSDLHKARARRLAAYLAEKYQLKLPHTQALEAIAATEGVRNWQTLVAQSHDCEDVFGGSLDPESLENSVYRLLGAAAAVEATHVDLIFDPGKQNISGRFRARGKRLENRKKLSGEWVRRMIGAIVDKSSPLEGADGVKLLDGSVSEAIGIYRGEVVNTPLHGGGQYMTVVLMYSESDRYKFEMAAAMREGKLDGRTEMVALNGQLWRHLSELQIFGSSQLIPFVLELTQVTLSDEDQHEAHSIAFDVVKYGANPLAETVLSWRKAESESIRALGTALLKKLNVKP